MNQVTEKTESQASCGQCQGCGNAEETTRRQFLRIMLGIFALSWGAMTTLPIIQYLMPAAKEESGQEVASVNLGKLESLPKGQGKNFQFGHKPGLIVRDEAGDLHAFSAICTHLGCTVQFNDEKDLIWCACHGGQYDPQSGKNIAGPPPKPLTPLKAEVVNGEIIVSKLPSPTITGAATGKES
jgi:Rieske Fe-S protein